MGPRCISPHLRLGLVVQKLKKIIINNEININKLNFTHMRLYVFQSDIKTYKFVLREFPG